MIEAARTTGLTVQTSIDAPSTLYGELWVSLASLLRSYTAVHGLNRKEQATVELGNEQILVRAAQRWLRLDRNNAQVSWAREDGPCGTLEFTVDGKLRDEADAQEEMDLKAEGWARELMQ